LRTKLPSKNRTFEASGEAGSRLTAVIYRDRYVQAFEESAPGAWAAAGTEIPFSSGHGDPELSIGDVFFSV
jgi:hypothetical protein